MKVLNSRPHGGVLYNGKLYEPGVPVEVDDEKHGSLGEHIIEKGSHVKATASNVKAGEAAAEKIASGEPLPPDEEEFDEEIVDKTTGAKSTRKSRRKKTGR